MVAVPDDALKGAAAAVTRGASTALATGVAAAAAAAAAATTTALSAGSSSIFLEDDNLPSAAEVLLTQVSDHLSRSFPLPFRILLLCTLGLVCWALNLHLLHLLGIDTSKILDIRHDPNFSNEHLHPSRLYGPVYQLAGFYAAWTALCWTIGFKWLAGGDGDSDVGRWVAGFSWVMALLFLVTPFDKLKKTERIMFLRALKRVATDTITRPVAFCDVILADILTSYAKVLGDVWVCVCSILGMQDEAAGFKDYGIPLMIALPYMFRFKQCLAEYYNTPWDAPTPFGSSTPYQPYSPQHLHHHHHTHQPSIFLAPSSAAPTPSSPKKRSLFNALKYASAFPVIFFSALQNQHGNVYHHPSLHDTIHARALHEGGLASYFKPSTLFNIWILAVFVNSCYSFWWDITNDWGLHLLLPSRFKKVVNINTGGSSSSSSAGNPTVLRRTLLFPTPIIYYVCIALDLILRLTWSLKLSSHLHAVHELEIGHFTLEALEVIRRWVWVYLRIEWEAVRKGSDPLEERLAMMSMSTARHPPNPSGPSSVMSSPNASSAALSYDPSSTSKPFLSTTSQIGAQPQVHSLPNNTSSTLDRRISSGHRKGLSSSSPYDLHDMDGDVVVDVPVPKITIGHHGPSSSLRRDKG